MYYIMLDEMSWEVDIGPTHILDKNYNFLPVHIGKDIFEINEEDEGYEEDVNFCTICISEDNYIMVNHKKPYIFLHEIDDEQPLFDNLSKEVREHIAEMLKIEIEDEKDMAREHTHIWGYGE